MPTPHPPAPPGARNQALKDAREVMPSKSPATPAPVIFRPSSSSSSASTSGSTALAVTDEVNGGSDAEKLSPTLVTPPGAIVTSRSAGKRELADEEKAAVAVGGVAVGGERWNGEGTGHVDRLKATAAGIMDRLVDLATFCDNTGASKDLEVCMCVCLYM